MTEQEWISSTWKQRITEAKVILKCKTLKELSQKLVVPYKKLCEWAAGKSIPTSPSIKTRFKEICVPEVHSDSAGIGMIIDGCSVDSIIPIVNRFLLTNNKDSIVIAMTAIANKISALFSKYFTDLHTITYSTNYSKFPIDLVIKINIPRKLCTHVNIMLLHGVDTKAELAMIGQVIQHDSLCRQFAYNVVDMSIHDMLTEIINTINKL